MTTAVPITAAQAIQSRIDTVDATIRDIHSGSRPDLRRAEWLCAYRQGLETAQLIAIDMEKP